MNDEHPTTTALDACLDRYRAMIEAVKPVATADDSGGVALLELAETEPKAADMTANMSAGAAHLPEADELPLAVRLAPLLARDAVQATLDEAAAPAPETLDRLLQLDRQLEACATAIFIDRDIEDCRDRLSPDEAAWWWFLEGKKVRPPAFLTQFDGLWNVGTAICLTFAATFITQTIQAFSTQGFDVLGTVSTIAQGAGLAFVAKGTLTDSGKEKLHESLENLGLPHAWHQEVTFLVAASVMASSYGINQNLYRFSDYYYNLGQQQERDQQWTAATKSYARAMDFNGSNEKALLGLGSLLEKLGEYKQAADIYQQGIPSGDPHFFNALGRSRLRHSLQENGWQGKLDRAVLSDARSLFTRARLHDETHDTAQLATDVYINLGIAQWASVDFNQTENTPSIDRAIFAAMHSFRKAVEVNEAQFVDWTQGYDGTIDLTTMYPWQLLRAQCFEAAAEAIAVVMDASPDLLPQATYTQGLDPRLVYDHVAYSCNELLANQDEVDAANNSILLESILLAERIAPFSTSNTRGFQGLTEIDPEASERHRKLLQQRLTDTMEKEGRIVTTRMPLVNRVIVDENTNILAVYAYDVFSLARLSQTPTYQLQQQNENATLGTPAADFWVYFHPFGDIEIVSWYQRYAVDRVDSRDRWKTRLPVEPRSVDRYHLSELGVLRALAYAQLRNYSESVRDWQALLDRKLVYQVFVAADGRIVGYTPAPQNGNEATRRINVTPLTFFPAEDTDNEAVAWFIASFKSSQAFQLDSGQKLQDVPVWDIPD